MSSKAEIHPVEQRHKTRVALPDPSPALDVHSGHTVGQVVNLSVDGMMLAGPMPVSPGSLRQFSIRVQHNGDDIELLLGVESLWCQDVNNTGISWTGFQIIDISAAHQAILDAFVNQ